MITTISLGEHKVQLDVSVYAKYCTKGLSIKNDGHGYLTVILSAKPYRHIALVKLLMDPILPFKVDHIDGNTLNCTQANLRLVTDSQSMMNRKSWGASKYKGVFRSGKKWSASIMKNRIKIHLGTFSTEEEAYAAYQSRANALFGEFALHNSRKDI